MNTLVVVKTKYSTISQLFVERIDALTFLNSMLKDLEVLTYEIKTVKTI